MKQVGLLAALWLSAIGTAAASQTHDVATVVNVRLLATGGTIAGSGQGSIYEPGVVPIDDILRTVPGLADVANVSAEQVANVGSFDIDEAIWLRLLGRVQAAAADPEISGVVITHGTDTLEETAYFLSLVLPSAKPVVVVGSMRPSTAVSADGPGNLLDAVRVAGSEQARGRGVLVVMNDTIFDPFSVTKTDIWRVDAFAAPGRGPIGEALNERPRFFADAATHEAAFSMVGATLPRVAIAYAYAGVRGEDIRAAATGADALVIAGAGAGSFSESASEAVRELIARGVPVVRTARQGAGDVWRNPIGMIAGRELSPAKARILLMLAMQTTRDREALQSLFDRYGTGGAGSTQPVPRS